jgi:hypothetical protein
VSPDQRKEASKAGKASWRKGVTCEVYEMQMKQQEGLPGKRNGWCIDPDVKRNTALGIKRDFHCWGGCHGKGSVEEESGKISKTIGTIEEFGQRRGL